MRPAITEPVPSRPVWSARPVATVLNLAPLMFVKFSHSCGLHGFEVQHGCIVELYCSRLAAPAPSLRSPQGRARIIAFWPWLSLLISVALFIYLPVRPVHSGARQSGRANSPPPHTFTRMTSYPGCIQTWREGSGGEAYYWAGPQTPEGTRGELFQTFKYSFIPRNLPWPTGCCERVITLRIMSCLPRSN